MEQEQKSKIKEALEQKVDRTGISFSKAAGLIRISDATISYIRKGQWEKVSDEMWRKVGLWCGALEDWVNAETTNFKRVYRICKHAQTRSLSKAISFAPGSGKSHTLKHYAINHENVIYIECDEHWNRKDFLFKLMQAMALDGEGLKVTEMVDQIIEHINKLKKALIIIDEADKLKDGVLNFFKTFYNKTKAGYVLCGAPFLKKRIEKGVRMSKQCYQEIFSRLGGEFVALNNIDEADIRLICRVNGVSDEADVVKVISAASGDLRNVRASIEDLMYVKEGRNAA